MCVCVCVYKPFAGDIRFDYTVTNISNQRTGQWLGADIFSQIVAQYTLKFVEDFLL